MEIYTEREMYQWLKETFLALAAAWPLGPPKIRLSLAASQLSDIHIMRTLQDLRNGTVA